MSASNASERLRRLEALAEEAYARMYDATSSTAAAGHYSDAKEALYDAIGLATSLPDAPAVERLERRLAHIKAIFRSQFS